MRSECNIHGSNVIGFTMESWITFTSPPPSSSSSAKKPFFPLLFTSLLAPEYHNSVHIPLPPRLFLTLNFLLLSRFDSRPFHALYLASLCPLPSPTPVLFGFAWRARRNDRIRQRETGPRWFERPVDGLVHRVTTRLGKKLG